MFTARTGGNSAGISASKGWVDTFWIGFANLLFTVLCCVLYRFVVFFKPVPTSRVFLGEKHEACCIWLAKVSIFHDFGYVSGSISEPLLPLGTFFNTLRPSVNFSTFFPGPFLTSHVASIFSWCLSISGGAWHASSMVNTCSFKILVFRVSAPDLND